METDKLKSLLEQMSEAPELQYDCPEDEILAAYMEGGLSDAGHMQFETHLADCPRCLERIGILGRAHESDSQEPVPELLLARAGKMSGKSRPSASGWRMTPAWAAAAVLVLTFGLVVSSLNLHDGKPEPVSRDNVDSTESTRSIAADALQSIQRSTGDDISVELSNGIFNWTPVNDCLFYQVRIVTAEGDLLWRERVHGEQWRPPNKLVLSSGAEYFVRIDAFLSETLSVNSDYIAFRTPERR